MKDTVDVWEEGSAAVPFISRARATAAMENLALLTQDSSIDQLPIGFVARFCGFNKEFLQALAALGAPLHDDQCQPAQLYTWLQESWAGLHGAYGVGR